jgi:hypothetical protein
MDVPVCGDMPVILISPIMPNWLGNGLRAREGLEIPVAFFSPFLRI